MGSGSGAAMPPPQASGYQLKFSDDFDALSLSPSGTGKYTWYPGIWWEPTPPDGNISSSNSMVELDWTGGESPTDTTITTFARDGSSFQSWRYGYFEARMKWTPTTGAWPAFWLLSTEGGSSSAAPASETGEIDIFEGQGASPTTYFGTIHDWVGNNDIYNNNNSNTYELPSDTDLSEYHLYGLLWTQGHVTWYFDNQEIGEYATSAVFDSQDYYILLSSQEGADWSAGNTSGVNVSKMPLDIDWVHVFQMP